MANDIKKVELEKILTVSERFKQTPLAINLAQSGKENFLNKVLANFYFVCKKNEDKLSKLDLNSVLEALTKCCQYELVPDNINACLLPYWNKDSKKFDLTFQPMYQGLMEGLYKTGICKSISSEVVFEGDDFDYNLGSQPFVKHKKDLRGKRDTKLAVYVDFELSNGARVVRVMTIAEVEKVRKIAKTQKVWNDNWEEMAIKTVIKRGYKHCPKTEKLSELIAYDNSVDYDFETEKEDKKIEGVKNIINGTAPAIEDKSEEPESIEVTAEAQKESEEDYWDKQDAKEQTQVAEVPANE